MKKFILVVATLAIAQTTDEVGKISKETVLELQNLQLEDEKITKPLQEIADMLLGPNRKRRNAVIEAECARFKLDVKNCILDLDHGIVKKGDKK